MIIEGLKITTHKNSTFLSFDTTLSVRIDGVLYDETVNDPIFMFGTDPACNRTQRTVKLLVSELAQLISKKLLEDHIVQATLGITSDDVAVRELAKLALSAGI